MHSAFGVGVMSMMHNRRVHTLTELDGVPYLHYLFVLTKQAVSQIAVTLAAMDYQFESV